MEYVWGRVGLGSLSYGPALAKQPAIPFSVDLRDIVYSLRFDWFGCYFQNVLSYCVGV